MSRTKKLPELPNVLLDMPYVYLLDRSGWHEYKRALNDLGLTWNLPDWMTTIAYKGKEWREIATRGTDLAEHFTDQMARKGGFLAAPLVEEGEVKVAPLNLVELLRLPQNVQDNQSVSSLFCNLSKIAFETDKKLPARQKFWNWMVRSLRGQRTVPGPFHYLVDEVDPCVGL